MATLDELRLLAKIARLYYEEGQTQPEIASRLSLSQAKVSRLLKRAKAEGIVRISVSAPTGSYPDLERRLEKRFGLKEAIVADSANEDEEMILREIGAAAAFYIESTLKPGEVVGISSWSETLLAMVDSMHSVSTNPVGAGSSARVVQILGGVGNPSAEAHAAHLTQRLASLIHAEPVYLPAPGVAPSAEARRLFLEDRFVGEAVSTFPKVSLALVGIGALAPSKLLFRSGNVFSEEELEHLQEGGAVGDICLRFFDAAGNPIAGPLEERVIGMDLPLLRKVPRSVGIAGGGRKLAAIRGALQGGLINVLITDRYTAERLDE